MNRIACSVCKCLHGLTISRNAALLSTLQRRLYSQFNPSYQEPVTDKTVLSEPLAVDDPRRFHPIRPPANDACPHVFSDPMIRDLVNAMMPEGQKHTAKVFIMETMENIKRKQLRKWMDAKTEEEKSKIEMNPVVIVRQAIRNTMPAMWLVPIMRGGILYQVPVPLDEAGGLYRAYRFIRETARDKHRSVHIEDQLAEDLLDAFYNEGRLIKKKQDINRRCEANKTYASYRWRTR